MKYSIIVPVYNGEKTIGKCLESLVKQNYPKKDYEIVVVNDGSTDKTVDVVRKFHVLLISLKRNMGQIKAREIGANTAKFDQLAFINANCIPEKNWLAGAKKANYQPSIGGVMGDPRRSRTDRFFYLMRKKIYHPSNNPVFVSSRDFYKRGNASGNLFCSKQLYLKCLPRRKGKYINDDSELFYNLLKHKRILYRSDSKIYHFELTQISKIFRQWFHRGSVFADFHIIYTKKYLYHFFIALSVFVAALLVGLWRPTFFLYETIIAISLLIIIAVYFCEKWSDLKFFFQYFILVTFAAGLGIIRRMKRIFFLYFTLLIFVTIYIHKLYFS